jgi:hypothetical protein
MEERLECGVAHLDAALVVNDDNPQGVVFEEGFEIGRPFLQGSFRLFALGNIAKKGTQDSALRRVDGHG